MSDMPTSANDTPFPLQENLKKIRASGGGWTYAIAGITMAMSSENVRERVLDWLTTMEGMVIAGVLIATILVLVAKTVGKSLWYNQYGIGVAQKFGGENKWYDFSELQDVRVSKRPGKLPSSIKLMFYRGTVSISTSSYQKKDMEPFVRQLEALKPASLGFGPAAEKARKQPVKKVGEGYEQRRK